METVTVDAAKEDLHDLLLKATEEQRKFRIISEDKEYSAVLLPEETYQNLLVTLELLSTPGLRHSMKMLQTSNGEMSE